MSPRIEIRRELDRFYWILKTANGQKIARSFNDFGRYQTAQRSAERAVKLVRNGVTWPTKPQHR